MLTCIAFTRQEYNSEHKCTGNLNGKENECSEVENTQDQMVKDREERNNGT